MAMAVLGLSYDFHDASAAVLQGGDVLASAAEERFTLQKHDSSFPRFASEACLQLAGVSPSELDVVAFYERPHETFTRVLSDVFSDYPRGTGRFGKSMKKWLGSKLWQRGSISRELGVSASRIELFPHHISHAAQAFCTSPFNDAAILIVDGVGEWGSTTLLHGRRGENFRTLEEYEYPQSLGLVYAAFTAFLGFKPNSGESSVMALTAFGKPSYVEKINRVLRRQPDDTYLVSTEHFDFLAEDHRLFRDSFCSIFGPPRDIRKNYPFDALGEKQVNVDDEDKYYADIAASLQAVLSDVLLGLCRRLRNYTGATNLCIGGGVALNCLANTELVRHSGFTQVFVPTDPGDGGGASGAAFLAGGLPTPNGRSTPYLGSLPESDQLRDLLQPDYLMNLIGESGLPNQFRPISVSIQTLDESALLRETVTDLANGRIVAWMQGRFESGPRALGNRSLLVDPSNLAAVRRMSSGVKHHVSFRPYALAMAQKFAEDVIDCPNVNLPILKWMQTIWPVRSAMIAKLRGGVHFDGTTRPQVCTGEDNELFWKLLMQFSAVSSVPALLNTSFNERTQPMVGRAPAALATFLRTAVDTLVVDGTIIRKKYNKAFV